MSFEEEVAARLANIEAELARTRDYGRQHGPQHGDHGDDSVPGDDVRGHGHSGTLAPIGADYLVGTADSDLTGEIVVGTAPGGELGGTWASPTVDATHSGSSHAGVIATHEAAGDPHTGYRLESADHTHESTGAEAGKLDHGLALNGLTDDDHTQYVLRSILTTNGDIFVRLAGAVSRRAVGSSGQLLQSDGTSPGYVSMSGDATIATGGGVTVAGTHSGSAHHTRSHAITGTSDHTAGNRKIFVSNGSGQITEVALAADNEYARSTGASGTIEFAPNPAGLSVHVKDPAAGLYGMMTVEKGAFTITGVYVVVLAGTSVTFNVLHHASYQTSGANKLWSSDKTVSASATPTAYTGSFDDPTVPDDLTIFVQIVSVSGSPTDFVLNLVGDYD